MRNKASAAAWKVCIPYSQSDEPSCCVMDDIQPVKSKSMSLGSLAIMSPQLMGVGFCVPLQRLLLTKMLPRKGRTYLRSGVIYHSGVLEGDEARTHAHVSIISPRSHLIYKHSLSTAENVTLFLPFLDHAAVYLRGVDSRGE
jgi:hypothetical protein